MFTLVVMAAGVGRRFGGDKQLAAVGPNGEAFLDYAIVDAVAAGASQVIVVVRSEIEASIQNHINQRHQQLERNGIDFRYVCQDRHGPSRQKPWGTAHAVLSAEPAMRASGHVNQMFAVCNADDYYGTRAFATLARASATTGQNNARLCGYRLPMTLPRSGAVNRGVCDLRDAATGSTSTTELAGIVEHLGVSHGPDGVITSRSPKATLAEDTIVSMNLWMFPTTAFTWLAEAFERFLASNPDPRTECLLPVAVAEQMSAGELTVQVVVTDEAWIGVTSREDLAVAVEALSHRRLEPPVTQTTT